VAAALVQKQINPNAPTGLVPQKVDQQYDGIQQLKKPLNFENQKESDDWKDTFNPNKKPDPGAYAQVEKKQDGNTASDNANNANLSGKPYLVKAFNGDAVVREVSNKWEGNAEYTTNTKTAGSERGPNPTVPAALAQATINPNGPTGLVPQKVDQQYDGIQQLKKPLNFENQKESDDWKDTFNPNKKPDPGAYAQVEKK